MADNDQLLGEEFTLNPDPNSQGSDQDPNYHELLVGDGKKYADDANLAKGYANLHAHTKTILDDKAKLEEELIKLRQSTSTVDTILEQISKGQAPAQHQADRFDDDKGGDQVLSQEDVVAILTGVLDKRTAADKQQSQEDKTLATQRETWGKLAEMYGDMDKAKAAANMYIGNDTAKKALFQQVGSSDPETLAKIMKVAVPPTAENVDFGQLETKKLPTGDGETFQAPTGLMTYAQAEVVRKADPRTYNSRQFQTRLHDSAGALPPEKFWQGTKRQKK